jgi:hypothetical protein
MAKFETNEAARVTQKAKKRKRAVWELAIARWAHPSMIH